jgi:hypothetical protein
LLVPSLLQLDSVTTYESNKASEAEETADLSASDGEAIAEISLVQPGRGKLFEQSGDGFFLTGNVQSSWCGQACLLITNVPIF